MPIWYNANSMKTILFMATSLNGIIATSDGSEDFLSDTNWRTFMGLAHKHGNIVYGRKTYETVLSWGEPYTSDLKSVKNKVVISSSLRSSPEEFRLAQIPEEAVKHLNEQGCETVLLSGGSTLNSSFAQAGLIDEVIFNIEPCVVGNGIPVFAPEKLTLQLGFAECQELENGIIQLRYVVNKN